MDNRELEQRIATLEKQLESLEGRYVTHLRSDGPRLGELEIKVQGLEARLKDFDKIETLVFDAYQHSHPEAQEGISEIERVVDKASHDFYFQNLPTIKYAKK